MDNMPDFDSMTPEEMMAWMEALAKRQGATEGLVTAGDMDVPEIDPESVAIDEPGYIPFGMDPEIWAQKKAKEDAERAERIAAMKAEKATSQTSAPAASAAPVDQEALDQTNPLDFLADMSSAPDVPSFEVSEEPAEAEQGFDFDAQEVGEELPAFEALDDAVAAQGDAPLDDLFAELASADIGSDSGDMEWLSSLGEAASDLPNLDALDFGSLEMLDEPEAQAESNPLEWLESLVSGDSDRVDAVAETEPPSAQAAAIADMDEMLLDDAGILEDSAVSAVLNDPMEWLADFAEASPMDELAGQAAGQPSASADEMDAFFDRLQTDDAALEAVGEEDFDSGLIDFGGTPSFEEDDMGIGSALTQGADVPAEDVKVWMDSLLDRGIQRTDVTDEDDEEALAEAGELPAWLVEQVGTPPATTDELLAAETDLPDWLTAPVTDAQTLEFEEMFNQLQAEPEEDSGQFSAADLEIPDVAPLDTGAIRVQMDDPWVEAFELERDERLSDTGKLAAWYESAAHEVEAARQSEAHRVQETASQPVIVQPAASALKSAQLPPDEELPPGEPQSVPTWLGGTAAATMAPLPPSVTPLVQPPTFTETPQSSGSDEELPDWLRAAQLESDEATQVPSWLTDSLTTDEFAILQLDRDGKPLPHPIQDEPTTPVPVIPATQEVSEKPITQRATSEARTTSVRPVRDAVPAHEAANVLNQARASQKMGDVGAMLDSYERLIRSEVALEDVESDMERVSKDAVHKSNPAVLRVYGDALLRRGKLQQALDTYRAALNLL